MVFSAEVRAMRDPRALPPAILLSVVAHLALLAAVGLAPAVRGEPVEARPEVAPVDVWAGTTAALPGSGGERTYDVEVGAGGPGAAPATALPHAAAAQAAAVKEEAPAVREAPVVKAKPVVKPARAPRREEGGDEAQAAEERPAMKVSPAANPRPAATGRSLPGTAEPGAQAAAAGPGGELGVASPGGGGEGSGRGEFGAEGAGAVRSLGRAFTRAIPPACQADKAWGALPAGSAGSARIVVEIDEAGHITGWKPEGAGPSQPLENLVKRTVALLRSGTFAVRGGAVTAGRQTIEISAVVSDAAAPEEGAVDSLAWRFEEGRGAASFTQASGRHVAITLRVVRTEVAEAGPPG